MLDAVWSCSLSFQELCAWFSVGCRCVRFMGSVSRGVWLSRQPVERCRELLFAGEKVTRAAEEASKLCASAYSHAFGAFARHILNERAHEVLWRAGLLAHSCLPGRKPAAIGVDSDNACQRTVNWVSNALKQTSSKPNSRRRPLIPHPSLSSLSSYAHCLSSRRSSPYSCPAPNQQSRLPHLHHQPQWLWWALSPLPA